MLLDTVGLTSTHSLGSGAQLLDLHFSGVACGDEQTATVDLLIACQLRRQMLQKRGSGNFHLLDCRVTPTVVENKNVTRKLQFFFQRLGGQDSK